MTKNEKKTNFIINANVVAVPMTFEEFCDAYNVQSAEYEIWEQGYAVELNEATTIFIDLNAFNDISTEHERIPN